MRYFRGLFAAFAVAVAALMLGAAPASAHAALLTSTPGEGAGIDAAPQRVMLTFNQDIEAYFAALMVTGPDGRHYTAGQPIVEGRDLSIATNGLGPAGTYTVAFRVVSADGHPISGQYTFDLTRAAAAAPRSAAATPTTSTATETAPSADGTPAWIVLAAAVTTVTVIGVLIWRRSARRN